MARKSNRIRQSAGRQRPGVARQAGVRPHGRPTRKTASVSRKATAAAGRTLTARGKPAQGKVGQGKVGQGKVAQRKVAQGKLGQGKLGRAAAGAATKANSERGSAARQGARRLAGAAQASVARSSAHPQKRSSVPKRSTASPSIQPSTARSVATSAAGSSSRRSQQVAKMKGIKGEVTTPRATTLKLGRKNSAQARPAAERSTPPAADLAGAKRRGPQRPNESTNKKVTEPLGVHEQLQPQLAEKLVRSSASPAVDRPRAGELVAAATGLDHGVITAVEATAPTQRSSTDAVNAEMPVSAGTPVNVGTLASEHDGHGRAQGPSQVASEQPEAPPSASLASSSHTGSNGAKFKSSPGYAAPSAELHPSEIHADQDVWGIRTSSASINSSTSSTNSANSASSDNNTSDKAGSEKMVASKNGSAKGVVKGAGKPSAKAAKGADKAGRNKAAAGGNSVFETNDTLKTTLQQIEKQFGEGSIMPLGNDKLNAIEGIPTGSLSLDLALGGQGVPRGRIIEVFGPESSGKTTLALHVIAQAQKQGGIAAFIDAEHALDPSWAKKLGVELATLLVSQPNSGEEAMHITEMLIKSNAVDVIVIDSVAALIPRQELEGEIGDSHVGLQARLMSQSMRKLTGAIARSKTCVIFINQIREKIGVMFGSPETTPGGRALKFYSSCRIDVRKIGQLKEGEIAIGQRVRVKIVKNKVAPPFRVAEFDMMHDNGISYEADVLDMATERKIVTRSGAWFRYGEHHLGQGKEKARQYLVENPQITAELAQKVLQVAGVSGELGGGAAGSQVDDDDDGDEMQDE